MNNLISAREAKSRYQEYASYINCIDQKIRDKSLVAQSTYALIPTAISSTIVKLLEGKGYMTKCEQLNMPSPEPMHRIQISWG